MEIGILQWRGTKKDPHTQTTGKYQLAVNMKPRRWKNNRKRSAPQWFCVPAAGADAIITANINKI